VFKQVQAALAKGQLAERPGLCDALDRRLNECDHVVGM
jgi:hypothetical protein